MYEALQNGRIHYIAKGGDSMRKCIYHGYWFPYSIIKEMSELAKVALDAVRHSRVYEFPDTLSTDEIGRLLEKAFMQEHPDFNAIEGAIEFLN